MDVAFTTFASQKFKTRATNKKQSSDKQHPRMPIAAENSSLKFELPTRRAGSTYDVASSDQRDSATDRPCDSRQHSMLTGRKREGDSSCFYHVDMMQTEDGSSPSATDKELSDPFHNPFHNPSDIPNAAWILSYPSITSQPFGHDCAQNQCRRAHLSICSSEFSLANNSEPVNKIDVKVSKAAAPALQNLTHLRILPFNIKPVENVGRFDMKEDSSQLSPCNPNPSDSADLT
eukprot:gene7988-712_t